MPSVSEAPILPEAAPVAPAAAPVVAELFTTQACVFCPEADRLFATLAQQPEIIALACHIDYFDVRRGSLSRPFCTERQNRYAERLASGPSYTPQMVVQGRFDVLGHKGEDVHRALRDAAALRTPAIAIAPAGEADSYVLSLPGEAVKDDAAADVWLAVYDRPHEITIAGGRNRGKIVTYYNAVGELTNLGAWKESMTVKIAPDAGRKGFAVLLQDRASGEILAAGKREFGSLPVPPAPAE